MVGRLPLLAALLWLGCQSAPQHSRTAGKEEEKAKVPELGCVCKRNINYVCGVDGKTYENDCIADCFKTSVDCHGKCPCEEASRSRAVGSLCDGVDAMLQDQQGTYFAFKGERMWRLVGKGVADSGNRIADNFPGIPPFLDTAFTCTGGCPDNQERVGVRFARSLARMYFFKGLEFWTHNQETGSTHGPSKISDYFPGLPNKLDAAFQFNRNKAVYFFRGSEYWKYDTRKGKMADGYPKLISQHWNGVPDNLDGVLPDWDIWTDSIWSNSSYFFRGSEYWRLDVDKEKVSVKEDYPKNSSIWFEGGCQVKDYDYDEDLFPKFSEPEEDPRYEPLGVNTVTSIIKDLVLP